MGYDYRKGCVSEAVVGGSVGPPHWALVHVVRPHLHSGVAQAEEILAGCRVPLDVAD